jgi:hypothetical protein
VFKSSCSPLKLSPLCYGAIHRHTSRANAHLYPSTYSTAIMPLILTHRNALVDNTRISSRVITNYLYRLSVFVQYRRLVTPSFSAVGLGERLRTEWEPLQQLNTHTISKASFKISKRAQIPFQLRSIFMMDSLSCTVQYSSFGTHRNSDDPIS